MAAKPLRVLLVDDEPDISALVAYHLAKESYRVRTAASGPEALQAIEAEAPFALQAVVERRAGKGREVVEGGDVELVFLREGEGLVERAVGVLVVVVGLLHDRALDALDRDHAFAFSVDGSLVVGQYLATRSEKRSTSGTNGRWRRG